MLHLLGLNRPNGNAARLSDDLPNLLKGQLCLITGASRGIGEQISLQFASRKATLILVAQDDERLQRVAAECRKRGAAACHTYSVNLFLREEVEKLADEVIKNHGDIQVLVNNAGIASASGMTALKGDPIEWEQVRPLLCREKDKTPGLDDEPELGNADASSSQIRSGDG